MKATVTATPALLVEDILAAICSWNTTKRQVTDRDVLNAQLLARSLWEMGWRKRQ